MHRIALALTLSLLTATISLAADPARVTVVFRTGREVKGELLSYAESVYRIRVNGAVLTVPAKDVDRVEFAVPRDELLAAQQEANEITYQRVRTRLEREAKGRFVAISEGRLLGVHPTLKAARAQVAKDSPRALHCLVAEVGVHTAKIVPLGSTHHLLNVGAKLLEALKGKVRVEPKQANRPAQLILTTDLGQMRVPDQSGDFFLPLLFGPTHGRLELARHRVSRDFPGALTVTHEVALQSGLFRDSLPGAVGLKSQGRILAARAVRVRVAISGLNIDQEVVAYVLPPKTALVPTGVWGGPELRITIDINDVDLKDVVEGIARQVGKKILVDPNVAEVVTVQLSDIRWQDAIKILAKMTRCELEERPGGILLLTQAPRVTISFHDADVRTVIQLLAAYSGKNVIIGPEVKGLVTLVVKNKHWLEVLRGLAAKVGAEVEMITEDLMRVSMPSKGPKPAAVPAPKPTKETKAARRELKAARVRRDRLDYAGAIKGFSLAINLNPKLAQAHYERGVCRLKIGKFVEGMLDLGRAVELNPRLADPLYNKVYQVGYVTDLNRILEELDLEAKRHPDQSHVVFLRGTFYLTKTEFKTFTVSDLEAGIKDFDRCLELTPGHVTALLYRGLLRLKLAALAGEIKTRNEGFSFALRDFLRALALDPKSGTSHYFQAIWWSVRSAEAGVDKPEATLRRGRAIAQLKASFKLGFKGYDRIRHEKHFAPLRAMPEFKALLSGR
ncbi:MAG: tetratricopeptide repeat protein [Planctomycetes bacterium]|nr:tetratricopeptide repeat protein [Planctomycetota bacterium]